MKQDFKWTYLAHLGMKMWGDLPMTESPKRDGIILRRHTKEEFEGEFCRRMPKTVVQNPWMYWTKKAKMDTEPYIQAFLTLAEAGYDVAPSGHRFSCLLSPFHSGSSC